jgi:small-conductance mechanosensitive channel
MGLPVQVGYDTDVEHALKLMEAAALAEPRVLKAPNGPTGFLVKFAENGIDLELGVWINDPENGQLNLRSALNQAIWRSFRAHGIEIPVPQRNVHVVGLPDGFAGAAPESRRAGPAG